MTRTFIQTKEFTQNWEELGFDEEDLRFLELDIMNHPEKFPVMIGTGGLRKARVPLKNKGKRSSARVCFVDYVLEETVYLITVYLKKDKDNLSKEECNDIRKMIERIRKSLGGKSYER